MKMNIAKLCLTLFFTLIFSSGTIYAQDLDSRAGDEKALVDLYSSTNGDSWHDKTGWSGHSISLEDDLAGVTVAMRDGELRVTAIDMQKVTYASDGGEAGNNLTGTLLSSLGNLKYCEKLNVKQNNLSGAIPPEIGYMTNLKRLSLGGQQGELENFGRRSQWYEANHRGGNTSGGKRFEETNQFSGPLPATFGQLSNLEFIEIRRQYLTGTLPPEWGGMTSLKAYFVSTIDTSEDRLGGPLPPEWGNWEELIFFQVTSYDDFGEQYGGDIPEEINLGWKNLANISISDCKFTGTIPVFPNSTDKRYLAMNSNNFTSGFPAGWFNGDNKTLTAVKLGGNGLTGELPATVGAAYDAISAFRISGNNFEGLLPEWVQENHRNVQIQIRWNNFTGPFPVTAAEQPKVRLFWIDGNNFSGELPDVDWNSNKLTQITMSGNDFEGPIPESWGSIIYNHLDENGEFTGRFHRFEAKGMNLSGPIPDWIYDVPAWQPGSTASLRRFRVQYNRYTFRDLLPTHEYLKTNLGGGYEVTPQKPFGVPRQRTAPSGGELVLDLSEFEYEGNEYQWTKDGSPIEGANASTLTISNVNSADEGEYVLRVSNPALPELGTHPSEPISFQIGENDGLNGGNSGDGSDKSDGGTGSFEFPAAPVQYTPENAIDNAPFTPRFSWSAIEGADYYTLHMSRNNPNGMVIDVNVVDTTYSHPEILGESSTHHWRVRAVKDGEPGEWSDIFELQTQQANQPAMADLVTPEHFSQSMSVTPQLEWSQVDADKFDIRIMEKSTSELVLSDETVNYDYTPDAPLTEQTAYIWQVKSVLNGVEGAWSPRWEFTTGKYDYTVDSPFLLSPNEGSEYKSLTPTFEWGSVDADTYVISVSLDNPSNAKVLSGAADETTVIFEEVPETHYTSEETLEPEATYFWRVKAIKSGVEGDWSETWEFITPDNQSAVSIFSDEDPQTTDLKQNYPNPFNPTTQIQFTLDSVQDVSLKVYDMAGRQVANLVNGVMQAGQHSTTFSADHLASGIYLYRFVSESHQFTRKMTLLK